MSVQRAKAEFHLISMEHGDLDGYVSKFERLARLAGYDLNSSLILDRFGSKLIPGLYAAIINGPDEPVTWTDWVRAAQKYQQKYLLIQANLGDRRSKDPAKGQRTAARNSGSRLCGQSRGIPTRWKLIASELGKSPQTKERSS
jgi:hypothetical protein